MRKRLQIGAIGQIPPGIDPALRGALESLKSHLEILLGIRGDDNLDRAALFRDLVNLRLIGEENVPRKRSDKFTPVHLLYEEGEWTPELTFDTPGDLIVAYQFNNGYFTRLGNRCVAQFNMTTTTFTHSSASGKCKVTGLPFVHSDRGGSGDLGALVWTGITKASYTNVVARVPINASFVDFEANGSGQTSVDVTAADMPSGGTVQLQATVAYLIQT